MKLYHITLKRRVPSIRRTGLFPPVALSNKRDLKRWLPAFAGNLYVAGRTGTLTVLEVRVPPSWVTKQKVDVANQYIVHKVIPPQRIRVHKHHSLHSIKEEGWMWETTTPEGRSRPLRFRSRKRRDFALVNLSRVSQRKNGESGA